MSLCYSHPTNIQSESHIQETESVSTTVQIDRKKRRAQDAVAELEQVGLTECNVLYNLNVVVGRVALTGAIHDALQDLAKVPGVKRVTTDMSTAEDWL